MLLFIYVGSVDEWHSFQLKLQMFIHILNVRGQHKICINLQKAEHQWLLKFISSYDWHHQNNNANFGFIFKYIFEWSIARDRNCSNIERNYIDIREMWTNQNKENRIKYFMWDFKFPNFWWSSRIISMLKHLLNIEWMSRSKVKIHIKINMHVAMNVNKESWR